jgi:glycosyltransferase involved in cell wall biosynthesis
LVSVITINFNNSSGLKKTIKSVNKQLTPVLEHIIVDGYSSDTSIADIQSDLKYYHKIICEPDAGIYDAMNKGISIANGDYVLFLNSGDTFFSENSLTHFSSFLGNYDILYGDMISILNEKMHYSSYPNSLSLEYMLSSGLPHPSTIFRKSIFLKQIGLYDLRYKIIADWTFFMIAIFKYGVNYKYIAQPISIFEGGGKSSKAENMPLIINEYFKFLRIHFKGHFDFFKSNNYIYKKYLRTTPRHIRWFILFVSNFKHLF